LAVLILVYLLPNGGTMKKQPLKLIIAAVFTLACWVIIDNFILPVSLVTYILIEGVIAVAHLLYEKQIKTLFHEEKKVGN
jgi:amino acid transporter